MSKTPKTPRLTRAQIAEGLDQIPLDTLLLGTRTETRLTAKQKEFARNLALGKSKAQSYREAYDSKGTKKTHSANGWKEAQKAEVQQIKAAYELAIEAAKQRTPAQLRELVLHRLTKEALDEDSPPNARIQALKLLGTVSEVAAFTERKEVTSIRKSEDVRAALMEKLRTISGQAVEGELITAEDSADSLLAEISTGTAQNDADNGKPTHTIDAGATNASEVIPYPQNNSDALESDCEGLIPESYTERAEVSEITGLYADVITESNIDGQPDAQDIEPASGPTLPAPPCIVDDHLGEDLHNVPHSGSQEKFVDPPIPTREQLKANGVELIGLDEIVSSNITVATPIVAEKDPADTPTPSSYE